MNKMDEEKEKASEKKTTMTHVMFYWKINESLEYEEKRLWVKFSMNRQCTAGMTVGVAENFTLK